MSQWRKRAAEGVSPGDRFSFSRAFSLGEVAAFGELTRDYNPVHYDDAFARLKGFEGPICHGLLAGSMICEIGGQLGWLATGMAFSFRRPVYPGDAITCELTVDSVDESRFARARARLTNQDGEGRFGCSATDPGVSLFNQSTAVLVLSENYILSSGLHEEALVRGIEGLIRMTTALRTGSPPS